MGTPIPRTGKVEKKVEEKKKLVAQPCFDIVQQDHFQVIFRAARGLGTTDPYMGKRHILRFTASLPRTDGMEASLPQRTTNARLRNVSDSGIASWVRKRLRVGNSVSVWTVDVEGCRVAIEATVGHCTRGFLGYLVRAESCVQPATLAGEAG